MPVEEWRLMEKWDTISLNRAGMLSIGHLAVNDLFLYEV